MPPRTRVSLLCASVAVVVLHVLFEATKWSTTSDRLNVVISWLAIAGYELLVLSFSRVSPKWLTLPSAAILLVPLVSSSILFPLSELFQPNPQAIVPIGDHLFYEVTQWANIEGGNAGVDIIIYHRLPLVPFLRHKLQVIRFNNQECNAYAAFAISLPAKHYLGRCPYWPSQSTGTLDKLFPVP
ncbi:MAG: hypothetical protein ABSA39_12680 [Edaphobacter sp.]